MKLWKATFRFILTMSTLLAATAAWANPERPCTGKTALEYVGQVLFVTEPIHELKLDQNSERGELKIESDAGDGFVMKLFRSEKKLEIVQDPTFGPLKKSLDCANGQSQATCDEYVSRALAEVKQAQFHLASGRQTEDEKRVALECAEETLEAMRSSLGE